MNRSTTRIRMTVISAMLAGAVAITGIGTAHAAEIGNSDNNSSAAVDGEATAEQVDELARYLEAIIDGKIKDAEGNFDYEKTRAEYGVAFADAIAHELDAKAHESEEAATRSYTSCLLKAVGLGGLGGATSAIVAKLKKRHFQDAARLIIKEAAKRGIKVGVKGGIAGMAAQLGAASVWCATPWA
ncbi:hypothetical protein [Streptomyces syringium]|uniref:hypothetical protein n=1 Tax=Streptomyces syringium TaxID=76729 RepID=UPI0037D6AD3C